MQARMRTTRGAMRSEVNTLEYGQKGELSVLFVVVVTKNISTAITIE